jgi:hypothetical protein
MKLETVAGTKDTVVSIGTATNTIKEFIKQGIVRTVKGVNYIESKAGSGLSYFSGTAPSLGAGSAVPPEPLEITLEDMIDYELVAPAESIEVAVNGTTTPLKGTLEYRIFGPDVLDPVTNTTDTQWRPFSVTDGTFARLAPLGLCTDAEVQIRDKAFPDTVVTSNKFSVTAAAE